MTALIVIGAVVFLFLIIAIGFAFRLSSDLDDREGL